MKDQRIEEHLQRLNGYILRLRKYSQIDDNEFINDETKIAAAERILQLAIETCLNIGNRILSLAQSDSEILIPENYSDIFRMLVRLQIIDPDKLENFLKMARFRNRLVHIYWNIDSALLHTYLKENISDFEYYFKNIVDYLNRN